MRPRMSTDIIQRQEEVTVPVKSKSITKASTKDNVVNGNGHQWFVSNNAKNASKSDKTQAEFKKCFN